ncbi:MAG TPA: GAF domain-containing protein [Candidatus Polarisedimenticolia bacterium]|nr:GAF domain-containing protein [Candidatus Polarisedimenticolia bacterium]
MARPGAQPQTAEAASAGFRALQRVTVAVRSQVDVPRVMDTLVSDAGRHLDLRVCALAFWHDEGAFLQVAHEYRREPDGVAYGSLYGRRYEPGADSAAAPFEAAVLQEHRVFTRAGRAGAADEASGVKVPGFLRELDELSLLVAPLVAGQRAEGLLTAARDTRRPDWTEGDQEFIRAAADLAAVALRHAALLRRLNLLTAAAEELNSRQDISGLLRRLAEAAMTGTGATMGMAGLRENGRLACREMRRGGSWEAAAIAVEPGRGLPGWSWEHRVPCMANDAAGDPRADQELVRRLGIVSALSVPIVSRDGDVVGFFELHNKAAGAPFTDDDVRFASTLAHHAALAVERVRG